MVDPGLDYPEEVIPSLRFQFCPLCAARLTRRVIFDDNLARVTCPACGWIQLLSNVVGVVVVARREDRIAAISPPGEAGVGLPAGLVEYGESPEEAAVREVLEETGLKAQIVCCLGWLFVQSTGFPGPMVQFIYEAEITGGTLKGSDEGTAQLYPIAAFPVISDRRIGSRRAMQAYLSGSQVV